MSDRVRNLECNGKWTFKEAIEFCAEHRQRFLSRRGSRILPGQRATRTWLKRLQAERDSDAAILNLIHDLGPEPSYLLVAGAVNLLSDS